MNKFNIFQAIYDNNMFDVHTQKTDTGTRPYAEILETVRETISKNHANELADVIFAPEGEPLLKMLLSKYIYQNHLTCTEYTDLNTLINKCYDDMAGFGFLSEYLNDDTVEEINCNRWDDVEIVTKDGWSKLDQHFMNPQQCSDMVKKMCRLGGIVIDGSAPVQDSYISQGVRISAIIPPVVDEDSGAVFSIRKQMKHLVTRQDLIKWETATDEELDFLNLCISYGVSLGLAGSTGSGKTTDMNYLLRNIPHDKRIYSIEDSRELDLIIRDENGKVINRAVHTQTRTSANEAQNVTADRLLKTSLRFHPDIIVPAETRGPEALTAQEAGRTGHVILTSLHASTVIGAYTRLMTMCMETGIRLSEELMLKLIIEAYPIMAFKKQLPDGSRKYMQIVEAEDYRNGEMIYHTLFEFVITDQVFSKDRTKIEKLVGYHRRTGNISYNLAKRLLENGAPIEEIKRFAGNDWAPANGPEVVE